MTRKITSAAIFLLTVCLLLSSCGYRLKLEKVEKETSAEAGQSSASAETLTSQTESTTEAPEESTLYDLENGPKMENNSDFVRVDLGTEEVVALYRSAMNDVKNNNPGFKKTEKQTTSDVTAGSGRTQLANGILNLVGQSILSGNGDGTVTVTRGDSNSVKNIFPLYNSAEGCALTSTSVIKSAECFTDGKEVKIFIKLNDTLNPSQDSEFAKIMKPADIDNIKNGISEYLVVLDFSQYQFDMNYTDCEIVCTIDKSTTRMTSLVHRTVAKVDININLDLIVFKTQSVKCSGTITDEITYSAFDW